MRSSAFDDEIGRVSVGPGARERCVTIPVVLHVVSKCIILFVDEI